MRRADGWRRRRRLTFSLADAPNFLRLIARFILALVVAAQVDDHCARHDQECILSWGYVNAIRVAKTEPTFGYGGHGLPVTRERIIVIQQIAFRLEVIGTRNVNRERGSKKCKEILAHDSKYIASTSDFVGGTQ
jgi:hypothetical protein